MDAACGACKRVSVEIVAGESLGQVVEVRILGAKLYDAVSLDLLRTAHLCELLPDVGMAR